jgi:hypothetical protein
MRASVIIGLGITILTTNFSFAENIQCPTQKQSDCSEIHPSSPIDCPREFCNVVSQSVAGKNVCMWTCAANLNGMRLNGIPLQDLVNTFKANKQKP